MAPPRWPQGTPPLADLIDTYTPLVRRRARSAGVLAKDLPDVLQTVFLRLSNAIVEGRLDTSRPLGPWLRKTTWSVVRDLRERCRTEYEVLVAPAHFEEVAVRVDQEARMHQAIDVHVLIERVLERLPRSSREVFELSDLDDMPMADIIKVLRIPHSTAYARLHAGRAEFAREWKAMQRSGDPAIAAFVFMETHELLAENHLLPDLPQNFEAEILRRLSRETGSDVTRTPVGSGRGGSFRVTSFQIGLGLLAAGLAGAGLHAALSRPEPSLAPPMILLHPPGSDTLALPAVKEMLASPPEAAPVETALVETTPTSALLSRESQVKILYHARSLVHGHEPARALRALMQITLPDLLDERDALRREALAEQADAGRP